MKRRLLSIMLWTGAMIVCCRGIYSFAGELLAQGSGQPDAYSESATQQFTHSWFPEPTTLLMWASIIGLAAMLYFRHRMKEV